MLTIIGLMPAAFALNTQADVAVRQLVDSARSAAPLIAKYGDDQKQIALQSVHRLEQAGPVLTSAGAAAGSNDRPGRSSMPPAPALSPQQSDPGAGRQEDPAAVRSAIRNEVYRLVSELKSVAENSAATPQEKAQANRIRGALRPSVEYAPWWVRVLSATCLGFGTMIGYKRIVHTLGERVGNTHLTPGQGASAELVGAGLIATAGFTGLPVSTTHIITSGIAGTMIGSRSGINRGMLMRIAMAWIFTLPVTILVAAAIFYVLD
jgi:inorganic phosphate transporter, PiT family